MPEIAGRRYDVVVGSDVGVRCGMFLELYEAEEQLLEVFCADADGAMTFSAFRSNLPLVVVEWAIGEGRIRLLPAS